MSLSLNQIRRPVPFLVTSLRLAVRIFVSMEQRLARKFSQREAVSLSMSGVSAGVGTGFSISTFPCSP